MTTSDDVLAVEYYLIGVVLLLAHIHAFAIWLMAVVVVVIHRAYLIWD